jgi:hypothetical protein
LFNRKNFVTGLRSAGTYLRMKIPSSPSSSSTRRPFSGLALSFLMIHFLVGPLALAAAETPAVVDDFSAVDHTCTGAARLVITDRQMGGQSHATTAIAEGRMAVTGELKPGRGAPGFVSVPLLLVPDAHPQDLSRYTGIRLRIKITQGTLTVQAASAAITNFDFHTSAPIARQPDEFQEIRIPFKTMKRAWSEQTSLDLATITSINLVSAGMAPGAFAYVVDEVGFY